MAYSMLPTSVNISVEAITVASSTRYAFTKECLQRIATAMGDEGWYADDVVTPESGWYLSTDSSTRYTGALSALLNDDYPNVAIFFVATTLSNNEPSQVHAIFNNLNTGDNIGFVGMFLGYSLFMDIYNINATTKAIVGNLETAGRQGQIIFTDKAIITSTWQSPMSNSNKGWAYFIFPDGTTDVTYYLNALFDNSGNSGYMGKTRTVFDKIYAENHPEIEFDGIYYLLRGADNQAKTVTRDGITYAILANTSGNGTNRTRLPMVISSEILGS